MIKKFNNFPFLNESDNDFTVIEFKNIVKDSEDFYDNGDPIQWTVDKLKELMMDKSVKINFMSPEEEEEFFKVAPHTDLGCGLGIVRDVSSHSNREERNVYIDVYFTNGRDYSMEWSVHSNQYITIDQRNIRNNRNIDPYGEDIWADDVGNFDRRLKNWDDLFGDPFDIPLPQYDMNNRRDRLARWANDVAINAGNPNYGPIYTPPKEDFEDEEREYQNRTGKFKSIKSGSRVRYIKKESEHYKKEGIIVKKRDDGKYSVLFDDNVRLAVLPKNIELI